jgi:hypothetical protein
MGDVACDPRSIPAEPNRPGWAGRIPDDYSSFVSGIAWEAATAGPGRDAAYSRHP